MEFPRAGSWGQCSLILLSPLGDLEDMGVLYQIYADDTQFLVKFDKEEESAARADIRMIMLCYKKQN